MLKKLVDTNIFINRFSNPDLYKDIFLSDGLIYLSSVVLMELRAGAHTQKALKAINVLSDHFKRVDRIVLPSIREDELSISPKVFYPAPGLTGSRDILR